jgi:2-dehydro-3-deoxygalactonokinase
MIAIDWGTTQLRAYRLNDAGAIASRRSQPKGIMAIPGGDLRPSMRSPATGMVRLIAKSS